MNLWTLINQVFGSIGKVWFYPLSVLPTYGQLLITALPVTILALLVFRYFSNQAGITNAKELIKGHLLELWLYKDDLGVMLAAQWAVMRHSLRYLAFAILPMLIMALPLAPVLVQVESQFAYRALQPGETAILSATLKTGTEITAIKATLGEQNGLAVQTPALRIADQRKLMWRIAGVTPGEHQLKLSIGKEEISRRVLVGATDVQLWPTTYRETDWRILGSPAEEPLPAGTAIESITLEYPPARGQFAGLSSAVWTLLLFTLILGFALRSSFGVTF